VLPDPDHLPTVLAENAVGLSVALPVASELLLPPLCIGLRPGAVLRTGVPEAAVDVDGNASGAEDDVGTRADAGHRRAIDSETQAAAVELRADRQLGQSVAPPDLRHLRALGGWGTYGPSGGHNVTSG